MLRSGCCKNTGLGWLKGQPCMDVFSLHVIFNMRLGWTCFNKTMGVGFLAPKTTIVELLSNITWLGRKLKWHAKGSRCSTAWGTQVHCWRIKFGGYLNHMDMLFFGVPHKCDYHKTCVIMPKKYLVENFITYLEISFTLSSKAFKGMGV